MTNLGPNVMKTGTKRPESSRAHCESPACRGSSSKKAAMLPAPNGDARAIACCESELGYGPIDDQPTTAWPSNVLLDSRLGDRVVVDVDSGHPLRRFTLGRPNGAHGSIRLCIPVVGEVAWLPINEP
jgi:hypothetical protein